MLLIIHSAGCASLTETGTARIYFPTSKYYVTNARFPQVFYITGVEGNGQSPVDLKPGRYDVTVHTIWSNWYEEHTALSFSVSEKKKYAIYFLELMPGQDPKSVYVRPATFLDEVGRFLAYPFVATSAIIYSPVALFDLVKASVNHPSERPYKDCCYVWIEDLDTGVVLAGTRPAGYVR